MQKRKRGDVVNERERSFLIQTSGTMVIGTVILWMHVAVVIFTSDVSWANVASSYETDMTDNYTDECNQTVMTTNESHWK